MTGYSNRDSVYSSNGDGQSHQNMEADCPPLQVESKEQLLNLLQTVESDIIPRLVETHRQVNSETAKQIENNFALQEQIDQFAHSLFKDDFQKVSENIKSLRDEGITEEILYLELFAPVARRLGVMWEQDLCSFTEVTIGVGRLQELLRQFSSEVRYGNNPEKDKRILLTPIPGEQHTFGMSMLIEFFYRAGWEVWGWPGVSEHNLLQLVKNEWFHIVGISMYAEIHTDALISTINAIRRASRNPSISVMVGGYAFTENPDLISTVGADGFAADANGALEKAEKLCSN